MNMWEREEQQLYDDYEAGFITNKELNKRLRELQREMAEEARGRAEEAAEEAYRNELEHW